MSENIPDTLLTIPEVAQTLRISRATTYNLLSSDGLKSVHIGSRRLVRSSDLAEYIANLSSGADNAASR
ncbi:helix-turn-helix domain-containing protein [Ferrimicrobium sp.]|uniref:helix-turn-helix domain-containing protein n=1 Tax=Ferrimicrobium sp. TaxID=2926050 RepID=UPI002637B032|nr:helix-turn-helix domain-containing protein [Ferrimicrobium sp.]